MKWTLIFLVTIFSALALTLTGFSRFGQTAHASFDLFQQACTDNNGQGSVCQDKTKPQDANGQNSIYGKGGLLAKAITILDIVIGIVSVIMVVVGGMKYVLSGGDSNNTNSARNTIIYALVGLVIAVLGQTIVTFVLNKL